MYKTDHQYGTVLIGTKNKVFYALLVCFSSHFSINYAFP